MRLAVAAASATILMALAYLGACFLAWHWIDMDPTAWRILILFWVICFCRAAIRSPD